MAMVQTTSCRRAEGLGLAGPGIASPTADAEPGIASPTADVAPDAAGTEEATDPVSTPCDEWRGGELPFLYQTDPSTATLPMPAPPWERPDAGRRAWPWSTSH